LNPPVVVLGGGLSGVATAYTLARAGWKDITVVERGPALGGLAGSFQRDGRFYPLGYHHILHRDRTLLYFLETIGALPAVRWRRIRMLFELQGRLYDLGTPGGFLAFPMSLPDKLRFVRLMLRAFFKEDWSDWTDRSGADLVDAWGGPGVREVLFEPLTRLKFQLPASEVSGAWLGARLYHREGSAPLGYIPAANWTKVLCDGVTRLLAEEGVTVRLGQSATRLETRGDRVEGALLASGETVRGDLFVSTLPTEVYLTLLPAEDTPGLRSIRYTALLSAVCATRQRVEPDFYWMNLATAGHAACGLFTLSSLNPTIGGPGETTVNFVTHLQSRADPVFARSDAELMAAYAEDFRRVFGRSLDPFWSNVARVPMYSPVFDRGYRNPPARSATWRNVYFAGNYRTFPSIASTGTALGSGLEAGAAILRDHGGATDLPDAVRRFRLHSLPRG
jgi:protoporphyrinogen oxidase